MINRINSKSNPTFFFLQYDSFFTVQNFFAIPNYFFVNQIIEKRPPLQPNARRAGWVGCNILLHKVPDNGKVHFVKNGALCQKNTVLTQWSKTLFISKTNIVGRGWIIDVLSAIEKLPNPKFSLQDLYSLEPEFKSKYPENNFIKPKIRQQLQVLRDKGFIKFLGAGQYEKI